MGAVLPLVEQTPDLAHHQLGRGLPPGQLPHDLEELRVVLGQRGRAGVEGAAPLPQQLRALRERRPTDPGLQRQQGRLHEHGHRSVLPRHLEQLLGRGVVEHHGPGGGQALAEPVPVVLDAHARLTHAHDGDGPVRLADRAPGPLGVPAGDEVRPLDAHGRGGPRGEGRAGRVVLLPPHDPGAALVPAGQGGGTARRGPAGAFGQGGAGPVPVDDVPQPPLPAGGRLVHGRGDEHEVGAPDVRGVHVPGGQVHEQAQHGLAAAALAARVLGDTDLAEPGGLQLPEGGERQVPARLAGPLAVGDGVEGVGVPGGEGGVGGHGPTLTRAGGPAAGATRPWDGIHTGRRRPGPRRARAGIRRAEHDRR